MTRDEFLFRYANLVVLTSSGCWEWTGYRKETGYGTVSINRKMLRVHRVVWELLNGPIPKAIHVLHRCDNPPCCNPDHLFLGTHTDNMRDAARKHRLVSASGEKHWKHKLTWDDVTDIRCGRYAGMTRVAIAKTLGVCPGTIAWILTGATWREVNRPKP